MLTNKLFRDNMIDRGWVNDWADKQPEDHGLTDSPLDPHTQPCLQSAFLFQFRTSELGRTLYHCGIDGPAA